MGKAISIIIPIYNVERYLRRCLDSVFQQYTQETEVIMVNDGSTDSSLAICKDYKKRYPETIIINKENGGLSDARNAGTAIATGKYIYYLDSDDWISAHAIPHFYEYVEQKGKRNLSVANIKTWINNMMTIHRFYMCLLVAGQAIKYQRFQRTLIANI